MFESSVSTIGQGWFSVEKVNPPQGFGPIAAAVMLPAVFPIAIGPAFMVPVSVMLHGSVNIGVLKLRVPTDLAVILPLGETLTAAEDVLTANAKAHTVKNAAKRSRTHVDIAILLCVVARRTHRPRRGKFERHRHGNHP